MQITNYEGKDLEQVESFLQSHPALETTTVKELLKTCNLSFILEGITRWQSTMICELKDSYVQQSQRYVTLSADGYVLPQLKDEDKQKAEALIGRAFSLYAEMSQLKEAFRGRPKKEHYLHGIPAVSYTHLTLPTT